MAKFGIKDLIAMQIVRKTEEGNCIIAAALRTPTGVVAKRAKMSRFGWVNTGILLPALDKGEDIPQEEATTLFGDSMKGFEPEPVKTTEENATKEEAAQ